MTSQLPDSFSASAQSFREWAQARPLAVSLARAEAGVRAAPQDAGARWLLFELLCVLGQWDRALMQLRTWSGLASGPGGVAQLMRGLVMAERERIDVFAGRGRPSPLIPTPALEGAPATSDEEAAPAWMTAIGEALRLAAAADAPAIEAGDAAREAALSLVAATPGISNLQPAFGWIADADSRLGPVCELMVAGRYRWLAFADIATVEKAAPTTLLDLVWSRVAVHLRDGTLLDGHMPMRYPVQHADRDALLLGRETVWTDVGRTGVFARGQKTWTTDLGDMPLLDLRRCSFGDQAIAEGEVHVAR